MDQHNFWSESGGGSRISGRGTVICIVDRFSCIDAQFFLFCFFLGGGGLIFVKYHIDHWSLTFSMGEEKAKMRI